MAAAPSSPTARSRELGRRLKELRESRGLTLVDIAEELSCSQAKVSRMETGQRPVQALDIKVLSRFYGLPDREHQQLIALAAESRKRGWWQDLDYLDEPAKTFLGLESAASEVWLVDVLRAPGLLQTPQYTREWVTQMRPPGWWKPESVQEVIDTRARRQERILDGTLRLRALVDERAFLATNRDFTRVLIEQVHHLEQSMKLTNIDLHLIPLNASPHPGLDGSFTLLQFNDDHLDDVVLVEGQFGNVVYERTTIVEQYRAVFELLLNRALPPDDTLTWLHQRHRELSEHLDSASDS